MGQRLLNEWILGRVSGIPADFAGVDGIFTNLAKEREPGIEISNARRIVSYCNTF